MLPVSMAAYEPASPKYPAVPNPDPQPHPDVANVQTYVVQPGDTCKRILQQQCGGEQYFTRTYNYRLHERAFCKGSSSRCGHGRHYHGRLVIGSTLCFSCDHECQHFVPEACAKPEVTVVKPGDTCTRILQHVCGHALDIKKAFCKESVSKCKAGRGLQVGAKLCYNCGYQCENEVAELCMKDESGL